MQIQELEPTPKNEVISLLESSHDNVSTTIDNGDHDLPIALRKAKENSPNTRYTYFLISWTLRNCHLPIKPSLSN